MELEIAFSDERQHLVEQLAAHVPAHCGKLILLADERRGVKDHRVRVCAKSKDRIGIVAFKSGILRGLGLEDKSHHAIAR